MRSKLIVLLIGLMLALPNVSFGFGIFQYAFDGIKNQLGLDRGPVSKVVPQENPNDPYFRSGQLPMKMHPDRNRLVIQAEGF